jgi:hypothetical protein
LYAPTTAVPPEIATDQPNWSLAAPSVAFSWTGAPHVVPVRVKTQAQPAPDLPSTALPGAPTTAVLPEIATELPK